MAEDIITEVEDMEPVRRIQVPQLTGVNKLFNQSGHLVGIYLTNISTTVDSRVYLCDGAASIDNVMVPLYVPKQTSKEVELSGCGLPFRVGLTLWAPAGVVIGAVFIRA